VTPDGSLYYLSRGLGQVLKVTYPPGQPLLWHNLRSPLDVDDDTFIAPIDALEIINWINAFGAGPLPTPNAVDSPPPYLDVAPDNFVAPNDILQVINYLNEPRSQAEGESEPTGENETGESDDIWLLLALDVAELQGRRRVR
jgi:hypothetical protein